MTNKLNNSSLLLFILCLMFIVPINIANAAGNVNAFLGFRSLDKDDWEPFERQSQGGVLIDFKGKNWPVSMAIDMFGSSSNDELTIINVPGSGLVLADWSADTSEFDIGVRKYWREQSNMRPFLGGGLAIIGAKLEGKTGRFDYVRDTDHGAGLWINGGVLWSLSKHFNIGFDARLSGADVTLFDKTYKANSFHMGLLLGYRWY